MGSSTRSGMATRERLVFRVTKDQTVTIGMYEWGHEHDGNPSGNWIPELTSRRDLAEMGWQDAGEMKARHTEPQTSWGHLVLLHTRLQSRRIIPAP